MDAALQAALTGDTETLNRILASDDLEIPQEQDTPPIQEATAEEEVEQVEEPETAEEVVEEITQEEGDGLEAQAQEQEEKVLLPDTEDITITDSKGRRNYTIDFTDREKTKKAYSYAAGFRKMQAERDASRKDHVSTKETYAKLEELWGEGGPDGIKRLINQLSEGGIDGFIDSELSDRKRLSDMTPEDKIAFDREQSEDVKRVEWETKMRDLDDKNSAHTQMLKEHEEGAYKSQADSAFARFNFSGKLGSGASENLLNKSVWENAIDMLEKHTPDDVRPTQQQFNKAFEVAYANLHATVKTSAVKAADNLVEGKKVEAAKSAAKVAKQGLQPKKSTAQALEATIDKGDFSSGMAAILGATKKLF